MNYLSKIVHNDISATKKVLLLRKGVKEADIPSFLRYYRSVEFPDKFKQTDAGFQYLVELFLNNVSF